MKDNYYNKNMWSRKFKECKSCKRSDRRHQSKGFCVTCNARQRYKNPKRKKQIIEANERYRKSLKKKTRKLSK